VDKEALGIEEGDGEEEEEEEEGGCLGWEAAELSTAFIFACAELENRVLCCDWLLVFELSGWVAM